MAPSATTISILPRGLRGPTLGILEDWTGLQWDTRLSDTGEAQVTIAGIAGASCRRLFSDIRKWQHELVIGWDDGFQWSGPIVQRNVQGGNGIIAARQLTEWAAHRLIHKNYDATTIDAADVYDDLWHDAIDADNSMRWTLQPVVSGIVIPTTIKATDRTLLSDAVQPLIEGGLDYVTVGRTTFVGAPDETLIPETLFDHHLVSVPDITEDGLAQANVYGVLGEQSGEKPAPYATWSNGQNGRDGLLEHVEQDSSVTTTPQAAMVAELREAVYGDVQPVLSTVVIRAQSPFTVPVLQPGRLLDVRLSVTGIPISATYRIMTTQGAIDQNAQKTITLTLAAP